jgi:DNA repair exonuclease SbcCD ATPase subunit
MKLIRITLHNAFSYKDATLNFSEHPFLLLKGDNGSGKTSLFEAICFALYGQTIKMGNTKDEIIRLGQKEGWCELEFEVGGSVYCVKRIRTKSSGKIRITKDGKKVHVKSLKQGDSYLVELVGVPYSVFAQSAIYGQGDNQRFVNTPDSERKRFLSDVLSLGKLKVAYERARDIHKDFEARADKSLARIEALTESVNSYTPTLASIERRGISTRLKNLRHRIQTTSQKRDSVSKQLVRSGNKKEQLDVLEEEIAAKKRKLAGLEGPGCDTETLKARIAATKSSITEIQHVMVGLNEAINYGNAKINSITEDISRNEKKIDMAESGFCPECDREYDDPRNTIIKLEGEINDSKGVLRSLQKDVSDMLEERSTHEARLAMLNNELTGFVDRLSESGDYFATKTTLDELRAKRDKLMEGSNPLDIEDLSSELQQLTKWLDSARSDAEKLVSRLNELARVKTNCLEIEKETKKLEQYKHFVAQAERLMNVFSKSGVQHKLVELVLPEFEELTNKYLQTIDNSGLSVEYRGFQKNKDGSVRDKLDVLVCKGQEVRKFESFSGGEKKRVLVASSLAEADIVARYTLLDFFLADEPFSELDEAGKFGLARLFEFLRERFGNVAVITHDERVQGIFTDVLGIQKRGGVSVICEN